LGPEPYALLLDECMVIGQQRMLAVLGLSAQKTTGQATHYADVVVLALVIGTSWTADAIEACLRKISQQQGRAPLYVVSDGAANLKKGIAQAGLVRLSDVSHQVALLVEHQYKQRADFLAFMSALTLCKFKGIMLAHAYLLPPRQRTIARFMNLGTVVGWAVELLGNFSRLSADEQTKFSWLLPYEALVVELGAVFSLTEELVNPLKMNGLSTLSSKVCLTLSEKVAPVIPATLVVTLRDWVLSERAKLSDPGSKWHVCTNCLESLFGTYQSALPSNGQSGITGVVLSICLQTGVGLDFDLGAGLESVSMSDLATWKSDNLPESQVVKRRKILKT